jgi:hypothetical protein
MTSGKAFFSPKKLKKTKIPLIFSYQVSIFFFPAFMTNHFKTKNKFSALIRKARKQKEAEQTLSALIGESKKS